MKIGFSGTKYGMSVSQKENLIRHLIALQPIEVHHGMCEGADTRFHDIVVQLINGKYIPTNCKIIGHPPINKSKYVYRLCDEYRETKDYLIRNHDIVDETDMLIACPLENEEVLRSGTWATIRYCKKVNKKFIIISRESNEYGIKRL